MAYTPLHQGSKSPAICFGRGGSLYESTPKDSSTSASASATHQASRKRKFTQMGGTPRHHADTTGDYNFAPPASSTLNESLISHLEKCNLVEGVAVDHVAADHRPVKCIKSDAEHGVGAAPPRCSPPGTPQKQVLGYYSPTTTTSSSSTITGYSKVLPHIIESPLSQTRDILYPSLKPIGGGGGGGRVSLTPKKQTGAISKRRPPPKRSLFADRDRDRALRLLQKVTGIDEVMGAVFRYLSDGDLYRMSQVSRGFERAVLANRSASGRVHAFTEHHKLDKENYRITPPASPEKDDTPPVSPESRHFYEFTKVAKILDRNQKLMKCLKCGGPAVVTDSIAQCTAGDRCGYICCVLCGSQSITGPEDFEDRCGKAVLQYSARELSDLSNFCEGPFSIFTSPSSRSTVSLSAVNSSSGYYSYSESEHTRSVSVKRNLSSSFNSSERILSVVNRMSPKRNRSKRKSAVTPLCKVSSVEEATEREQQPAWDPPSPPKAQDYIICSRKSKRNLKRLTR